jgi:hypothetical protein
MIKNEKGEISPFEKKKFIDGAFGFDIPYK